MPRSLPFELQEMILRRLGRSFSRPLPFPITRDLVIRALLVCCRVCKAWLPISRSYLLKVVALYSGSQLERIIPTLSSSQDFAGRFVKELSLEFIESNQRPFHHLVPHYLATKLPSIEALDIRAGESEFQRVFPIHTSLILHLRQFRTLRSLHIDQYSFPTFWDLRSIVVSLPALGQLGLSEVTWTRRSEDHRNIPRMLVTSHCLSRVIVSRCPSPSEMIWFWATSSRPRSTSDINARTLRTSSFPTLTVHDAGQIENISQHILEEDSTTQWEWDEAWGKRGSWVLKYNLSDQPMNLMSFAFEPDVHENGQLQYLFNSARRGNAVICRLRASTLKIDYLERSSIEWGIVDKIYDRLEGLCEMRIEIEGVKKKQSDDVWAYARKVERSLTSLRARRDISLIFVANGETILWETLEGDSESNHDEYWSEEGDLDWVLLRTRWLRSQYL